MFKKYILIFLCILILFPASAQKGKHIFEIRNSEFLLDKKPFQVISGEIDPSRVPQENWIHAIRMAKSLGVNTITASIYWNHHEIKEGEFDFTTENRNLTKFFEIAGAEKMFLILKTGPYNGTGWEGGGIPSYLLKNPGIKLRSTDAAFTAAAGRFISELAAVMKPFQATKGGPVLMVQIEDGNDPGYISWLKKKWADNDLDIPVLTGKESVPDTYILLAGQRNRCIHWAEKPESPDTAAFLGQIRSLMKSGKSFNINLHGGTCFGYTSGACSVNNSYEPDITNYDLAAPVNGQGAPGQLYSALRKIFEDNLPKGRKLDEIPKPIPVFEIPALSMGPFTSIWDNLPQPVSSDTPKTFEDLNQDNGFILYRTELPSPDSGKLTVNDVHDFATVFLDGQFIGSLNRMTGINSINIPRSNAKVPVLEILVESMGRMAENDLNDRKGITERVMLNNTELKNWKIYSLPMDWKFIYGIRSTGRNLKKPGIFFKGNFSLVDKADTYFDVSGYTKGIVWINGHNLGRFWNIGPQQRLYCPASWIKMGMNEIMIFDLIGTDAKPFSSFKTIE